jgi:hypothetical protein
MGNRRAACGIPCRPCRGSPGISRRRSICCAPCLRKGRVALELQLLIGLAVSLAVSRSYAVPEVGRDLTEAREICNALGNVADLFVVLRAICSFPIVAGDLVGAEQTARACLGIGEQTGLPAGSMRWRRMPGR